MFTKIQDEPVVYNLAFGDENSVTGLVDDLTITDNKDRDVVHVTVANTINKFCHYYGNQYIYPKEAHLQEPDFIK